jgi:hypothetical protein
MHGASLRVRAVAALVHGTNETNGRAIREYGTRVLAYLDDFIIAPSRAGCIASHRACRRTANWIDKLL